jgi:hypothetical protein
MHLLDVSSGFFVYFFPFLSLFYFSIIDHICVCVCVISLTLTSTQSYALQSEKKKKKSSGEIITKILLSKPKDFSMKYWFLQIIYIYIYISLIHG